MNNSIAGLLTALAGFRPDTLRAELAEYLRLREWVEGGGLGVGVGDQAVLTRDAETVSFFHGERYSYPAGTTGRVRELYLDPRPDGAWVVYLELAGQDDLPVPLRKVVPVLIDAVRRRAAPVVAAGE